ncbi:hypothetical protein ACWX0K_14960 [Nitrobacteraceae bacterium UC4446_H13]
MAGTDLYPVAGSKIFIGGTMATQSDDFDAADFTSVTWVEIDGWSQMGAVGDAAQVISTDLINRGRTTKQKGTRNAGSMQNVFAKIAADAGQAALIAAEKTSSNYAFKIEFDDAATSPASPTPQPSKVYFVGLVTSAQQAGGTANTVQNINSTIEINSNVVNVAANP